MRNRIKMRSNLTSVGGYKLVWTNPNPNVAFSSQQIVMPKEYSLYLCKIKYNTSSDYYTFIQVSKKNGSQGFGITKTPYTDTRLFELLGDNKTIVVNNCVGTTGDVVNNNLIPLEIYATNKEIG